MCHAAVEAFASFVEQMESRRLIPFQDLVPVLCEAVAQNLKQDADIGEETLNCVSTMVEADPKFFKKHFETLFQTMQAIVMTADLDASVKRFATEILTQLVERVPSVIRARPALLAQLVEQIFWHMVQVDDAPEPEPSWCVPKEGFNEDANNNGNNNEDEDEDLVITRFGMNSIDKIISAVGEKETLPLVSQTVQQLLQSGSTDWRHPFAAIMALSQVGEYIEDIKEVAPILQAILKFLQAKDPRLRYAVCHALGQIADDMKPDF